ncbi:MAG: hypothetical protein KatS3mg060_2497 [Dehalococcoidia bacterium]|nr:MAG: hypothetical protein KatS3mg060_2497 [Dehalococcoidia bacterium]
MDPETLLRHAAQRARREPTLLGFLLAQYQEHYGLTEKRLAEVLGIDELGLARLSLCGLPRRTSFFEDVGAIAGRTGVRERELAVIIREAEFLRNRRRERDAWFNFRAARRQEDDEET